MNSTRYQRLIAQVAIFAILLTSLVPTLSLAFPMASAKNFTQEICSTQGQKLVIQVITTQGKLLATALDVQPQSQPNALNHHLKHCPFCQLAIDDVLMPSANPAYVLFQQAQVRLALSVYQAPVVASFDATAHPTRAPPAFTHR